jgi:FMN phosphatase YigB (HAD superfamily)
MDTRVMLAMSRSRLLAVGWDFDDTLYLGDKEELRERVQYISEKLSLGFNDEQVTDICSKSRWDEQKRAMIQSGLSNGKILTDEQIEGKQAEAKPKFSHLLRMDENAIDTLSLLQRKGVPQFLITNR